MGVVESLGPLAPFTATYALISTGGPLIEGKRFYWVEDMGAYNPRAYLILVTSKDRPELQLVRYDPTEGDGPLFHEKCAWTSI